MTTALFLLRCVQLGLTIESLEELDIGLVLDMMVEKANDDYDWKQVATQEDFDKF